MSLRIFTVLGYIQCPWGIFTVLGNIYNVLTLYILSLEKETRIRPIVEVK